MNEKLKEIIGSYKDEMVENLRRLVRIESVAVQDENKCSEAAPFGDGPRKAMEYMMKLGKDKGFDIINYDNKACELNFGSKLDEAVGIAGHLDVVPAGGEWRYPPYGGELHDGRIYGRGTVDDKGPAIAAFYAALAIRESGLPLKRNITQILGTNEEGGNFPCIRHYLEKAERIPICGIIPDSYFPICFSEKHFINTRFTVKADVLSKGEIGSGEKDNTSKRILRSVKGGDAINIVPSWAEAVFEDENGDVLEIVRCDGATAHASTPQQGDNAISKLIKRLAREDFEPESICMAMRSLSELICSDTDGSGLGIYVSDETGETTNNVGFISYKAGTLTIETNARLPLSLDEKDVEERINKTLAGMGIEFELTHFLEGFYADIEKEPAKTLLDVYREETGDMKSKPYANGSGSYARIMKDFIPFGIAIQDEPLQFHVEDESISIDRLVEVTEIYAEALYRLAVK